MAEFTNPTYKRSKINQKPLSMGGRTSVNKNIVSDPGVEHQLRVSEIFTEGINQIHQAYQKAEQNRLRQEVAEERLKIDAHILKQENIRDNNIASISAKHLSPMYLEEDFHDEGGYAYGDHTLTPYTMSEDLSEDAKKQIEPLVKYSNQAFMLKSQTAFTKELVARGKKTLELDRAKGLNAFNETITRESRSEDMPIDFWKPNNNEYAENAAKDFELRLSEEVKHETIRQDEADLMLFNYKQDMAGILFSRHLSQNPKEALEQIKKGFKVKAGHIELTMGDDTVRGVKYNYLDGSYAVGGVSVDSAKVSKYLDDALKREAIDAEKEADNQFFAIQRNRAISNPELFLNDVAQLVVSEPLDIERNEINLGEKPRDVKIERWIPKEGILNLPEFARYDKSVLEKHIALASKGLDKLEAEERKRVFNNVMGHMDLDVGSQNLLIQRFHITKNFEWKEGSGWRPKESVVNEISEEYDQDKTEVDTAMLQIIKPYAHKKWLSSNEPLNSDDYDNLTDAILKYWDTRIRKAKNSTIIHPKDNERSNFRSLYDAMSGEQQKKIHRMEKILAELEGDYRRSNDISVAELNGIVKKYETLYFDEKHRQTPEYDLWKRTYQQNFGPRIKALLEVPHATSISDIDNGRIITYMLKGYDDGGTTPHEASEDDRKKIFNRMKKLGLISKDKIFIPADQEYNGPDAKRFQWSDYEPESVDALTRSLHGLDDDIDVEEVE